MMVLESFSHVQTDSKESIRQISKLLILSTAIDLVEYSVELNRGSTRGQCEVAAMTQSAFVLNLTAQGE